MTDAIKNIRWKPSPNFNGRPNGQAPDMLVLHYTGMETGQAALDRMCDPSAEVSAHYMIWENGQIDQLVLDSDRAWHAGISHWQERDNLNHYSIGIEIVNRGQDDFPALQMQAVCDLCVYLVQMYRIPAKNIVGHSDIAPDRKEDPGPKFNWGQLARAGVGFAVPLGHRNALNENYSCDPKTAIACLQEIGYNIDLSDNEAQPQCAVKAFQMRWLQNHVTGELDSVTEQTIKAVHQLYLTEDT